jgi:hypothetical protein
MRKKENAKRTGAQASSLAMSICFLDANLPLLTDKLKKAEMFWSILFISACLLINAFSRSKTPLNATETH